MGIWSMSTLIRHLREHKGSRVMATWWGTMALAMSLAAAPAVACPTFSEDLGEPSQEEALLNGLYLVEYDRDGDGRPDYGMLFQIVGTSWDGTVTTTLPHPLFYWVDTDKSGRYNETWIDRGGQGRCQDIVPYWSRPRETASDEFLKEPVHPGVINGAH